ncbi:stonustoxin subunit beta-like isoform 1-T2 [Aulostomus maculatus]
MEQRGVHLAGEAVSCPTLEKDEESADSVEELKTAGASSAGAEGLVCDVCTGTKLDAIKFCRVCYLSYCEEHLQPHCDSDRLKRHKLVQPWERNKCSRHDEPMKMFCRTDVQQICGLCWAEQHRGHDIVSAAAEREELLKYSREVSLDPNTAHRLILLSEGNRKATLMETPRSYSRHPERFRGDSYQVLSREAVTGRCYWEADVSQGLVGVAVAYKSISRAENRFNKSQNVFGNDKSWALYCFHGTYQYFHKGVLTSISGPPSKRVGVYLDHSAGVLSFYSVSETMTLLHRVQTTFTQPLHVGVRLWFHRGSVEFFQLKQPQVSDDSPL